MRYIAPFFIANAGMLAIFQGLQQIILPAQIASLGDESKVGSYGLIASIGALAAALSNPLFGAISDRTRSRFGRRAPWLLLTAVVSFLVMLLLAGASTLFLIGAAYVLVMVSTGGYQAVIATTVPDRVPERFRGTISSLAATGSTLGSIVAINIAAKLVDQPFLANAVIASILVIATIVLVVIAPDPTASTSAPEAQVKRERQSSSSFFAGLKDHDFAWAFWSRVAIMVGYWTVSTYQLYTLTDYIGAENLPGGNVTAATALLGTINLGCTGAMSFLAGPLSDLVKRRKVFVVVASIGVGIGALIPVVMPTWTGMIAFSVVMGISFGTYYAIDAAIMTLVLPSSENSGRDLGLLNIGNTGPQIAGPFIAAVIISLAGGYQALYIFCALVAVAAAFLILPIRKVR
ncbi:MFS transporter [Demequina sp. NBRC 110055]|uniref:MFS transporter n=1 Tax=Demequina sp. NBRC 110055 TaxID=1570344 RepID=UPI0013564796|nr:MFS transporter [Demequina sp. NBRC 110055]